MKGVPAYVGMQVATAVAARIQGVTPVLSGRLAGSVGAVPIPFGGGVTYGGGVPYAGKIERSQHPVRKGSVGSAPLFKAAATAQTAKEIASL
jgi:hypothetical protein